MPRLNINKEFGFGWSGYDDWHWCQDEEEWMTNEEYEFHRTYGSYLCIRKPLSGDNYPFREAFRRHQQIKQGWDFGDWRTGKRVGNISIWKYVTMIIDNNIGKSFDKTFSYYLKRTQHIPDYIRHHSFLEEFDKNRYQNYEIDHNGNIQERERKMSKWMQEHHDKMKLPYTFISGDYHIEKVHKYTGESYTSLKKRDSWNKAFRRHSEEHAFEEIIISGYYVEDVIRGSKLEKRLNREKESKSRQFDRERKARLKNYQYSFLTREEEEIKKQKLEDNNIKLRHGFGDESFVGEPYHGRKNKKLNK